MYKLLKIQKNWYSGRIIISKLLHCYCPKQIKRTAISNHVKNLAYSLRLVNSTVNENLISLAVDSVLLLQPENPVGALHGM